MTDHGPLIVTYNQSTDHPETFPRVSNALAGLFAGQHDLTIFDNNRYNDGRDKAAFVYGLIQTYNLTMDVGYVEHTGDWDWYVQAQTHDGRWHGDYAHNGKIDDDADGPYCDVIEAMYTEETYPHMGPDLHPDTYGNLTIKLTIDDDDSPDARREEIIRIGDLHTLVISER